MEKPLTVPCPENNDGCKYAPNCMLSLHHTVPRRLGTIAFEAGRSEEYQHKLKKVINHPSTHMYVCRNIHDLLDYATSDELPTEQQLDRRLGQFRD